MFTGIVQVCGRVAGTRPQASGLRLDIDRPTWACAPPAHGDSICVSGVCLTVAGGDDRVLSFDVVSETLTKTTLGSLGVGGAVNLEPAVTPATPLGGHFVQGHVDAMGVVSRVQRNGGECRMRFEPLDSGMADQADSVLEAVVPKGSVTIDGVSLTVAGVDRSGFEVALIPTTLERTTLGSLKQGGRVNIETDMISRTIVHWLSRHFDLKPGQTVTAEALRRAGFVE